MPLDAFYVNKKRTRAYNTLSETFGQPVKEIFSEEPTRHLILVNVGATGHGGVNEDALRELLLRRFQGVVTVNMAFGRPYSTVTCESAEAASAIKSSLNEKPNEELNKKVVLVEFLRTRPSILRSLPSDYGFSTSRSVSPIHEILLPSPAQIIPGLILVEEFITEPEEAAIIEFAKARPWDQIRKRQVQHYGHIFEYGTNKFKDPVVHNAAPMPSWTIPILERLYDRLHKDIPGLPLPSDWDQLTIQSYKPNGGIPPHIDTHSVFDGAILSISLLSPVLMEFKPVSKFCEWPDTNAKALVTIDLTPRSCLVMTGASRYGWSHTIRERTTDIVSDAEGGTTIRRRTERWSLTFRRCRTGSSWINVNSPCKCMGRWPDTCDVPWGNS
ncbi:hypothetical protein BZG36_03879 [Bifiguratus adelaidae]|uniref:Fe2OG dioxygenase domain-containing protein n=1 Tax=Bifiguratus adelaidae TaxID=1938954 RepID=A0A261XXT2_9FUNG|nr:hypothetical protein BZG36_03879 [Bifiguratus adelaidae]